MQQKKYLLGLLTLLLLISCGALGEDGRFTTDTAETGSTNTTLRYTGDKPAEGKGNLFGEIRWNGSGAADLEVAICTNHSFFGGCGDTSFLAKTDENGRFLFKNINPGVYALSVRLFNSDDWLYISGGILRAAEFKVEAGKTLVAGVHPIYKRDLKPRTPTNGSKMPAGEVQLTWASYPDADYYKITLYPDQGDAIVYEKQVNETSMRLDLLPVNCGYRWRVEAFNSDRIKIAETAKPFDFVVDSLNGSCLLAIQEPADGAEIRGDNIILDWDDSPLATTYKILMWNDDDPNRTHVLSFKEVNESSYRLTEALSPARYVWSVTAYNASGSKIGGTEIYDFTVRP